MDHDSSKLGGEEGVAGGLAMFQRISANEMAQHHQGRGSGDPGGSGAGEGHFKRGSAGQSVASSSRHSVVGGGGGGGVAAAAAGVRPVVSRSSNGMFERVNRNQIMASLEVGGPR